MRLGEPLELPWWVPVAMLPPLVVLVGSIVVGPIGGRLVGALGSLGLLVAITAVATRVESRNLQSVWISSAYGIWFFAALIWAVGVSAGR